MGDKKGTGQMPHFTGTEWYQCTKVIQRQLSKSDKQKNQAIPLPSTTQENSPTPKSVPVSVHRGGGLFYQ
jgi:hypothetical protein